MKIVIFNEHIEDKLGGSELQCNIIANKLTEFGHEVTYLAVKGNQTEYTSSYSVKSVWLNQPGELKNLLRKLNPDIAYWRYNRNYFHQTMKVLDELKIPVVFSVSHKNDITPNRPDLLIPKNGLRDTFRNWKAFWENKKQFKGFRYVSGVSNQCRDFMGRLDVKREIYFPNSIVKDSTGFTWNRNYCVWVSSLKKRKDPDSLIRLARELENEGEDIDILMAGEIQDPDYQYFHEPQNLPSNLHYLGLKSYAEVNGMIENSRFLIHTCHPEGFPNNFIQAWAYGKPVVSLHYDPDSLIEKEGLGFYSRSFRDFVDDVRKLLHNRALRHEMGKMAGIFSERMFDPQKNVQKLESFMMEITGKQ